MERWERTCSVVNGKDDAEVKEGLRYYEVLKM